MCVCVCVVAKHLYRLNLLMILGDVKPNFLNQIEEEFENQLDRYVEFVDMTYFASMFSKASDMWTNLISMASHFRFFLIIKLKYLYIIF
jgi:hypothetical protein